MHYSPSGRSLARFALLAVAVVLTAGCDPSHPFVDVRVTVFSAGDGRAEVGVLARPPEGQVVQEPELAAAVVEALDLGDATQVGARRDGVEPERVTFEVGGVDQDRISVSIADVLGVMERFGYPSTTSSFVSVCAPAEAGRAFGTAVDIGRYSSCASWESTTPGASVTAEAGLEFGDHRPPWFTYAVWAGLLALLALVAGAVSAAVRAPSAIRVLTLLVSGFFSLSLIGLGLLAAIAGLRHDTFSETGQEFDRHLRGGYFRTGLVAFGSAIVVLGLVAVANARAKRNSRSS